MKTLITGGAGFIGSHLVDLLIAENHEVTVLDNFSTGRPNNLAHVADQVRLIQCDLSIEGSWQDDFQGVDWVFHLAALADIVPSIQQPKAYFQSNVDGTFHVLQAAKERGVRRFMYAASSSCYGMPDQYPTPETAQIRPQYPYALTKRLGEELVMHWDQLYELPALSLRFFNVYGSGQSPEGTYAAVIPKFTDLMIKGIAPTINGDGLNTRDFVHVEDVCEAIMKLIDGEWKSKDYHVYNVATQSKVTILNLVSEINTCLTNLVPNFKPLNPIHGPERIGDIRHSTASIKRITENLDWSPKVDFKKGINDIVIERLNLM